MPVFLVGEVSVLRSSSLHTKRCVSHFPNPCIAYILDSKQEIKTHNICEGKVRESFGILCEEQWQLALKTV